MKCLIVRSPSQNDPHLKLSNKYAESLISRLKTEGFSVLDFSEMDDNWSSLYNHLSSNINTEELIVLFTHGEIYDLPYFDCSDRCNHSGSNYESCSCAIGEEAKAVDTESTELLVNKGIHGASSCFLGIIFREKVLNDGAKFFIGYWHEYWHINISSDMENPFQDVINLGSLELIKGVDVNTVKNYMIDKYQEWIDKDWNDEEEPSDWWLVKECLKNNKRFLVC